MTVADEQAQLVSNVLELAASEQRWALLMTGTGALAIVGAIGCFLIWPTVFARGAGWPLLLLGSVFLVSGISTFRRAALEPLEVPMVVREAPHLVESSLLPRTNELELTLSALRWVDAGLGLAGLVLLVFRGRARGAGAALLVMSLAAGAFDVMGLERAGDRRRHLEHLARVLP